MAIAEAFMNRQAAPAAVPVYRRVSVCRQRHRRAGVGPREKVKKVGALLGVLLGAAVLFAQRGDRPERIVSVIPATTEMIFAMGAGDRLAGVGNFDRFPPEQVSKLPRVGGLLDPDTERILALKPDLVIVYNTQTELKARLDRPNVPYFSYEHRALPDVMQTIRALGTRLGVPANAERLASGME